MKDLAKVEAFFKDKLDLEFKDWNLAMIAITHSSAKETNLDCNERLEFLGDSVLGTIVCEYLYDKFPELQEGQLSMIKSVLVSSKTLSKVAKSLGLDKILVTGKGISSSKLPTSLLADAMEALIAAIYLDINMQKAREFIETNIIEKYVGEIVKDRYEKNYKSLLQDYAQRHALPLPEYKVGKEVGPDHKKRFQMYVYLDNMNYGPSWGYSKKEAEQKVAKMALESLEEKSNSKKDT